MDLVIISKFYVRELVSMEFLSASKTAKFKAIVGMFFQIFPLKPLEFHNRLDLINNSCRVSFNMIYTCKYILFTGVLVDISIIECFSYNITSV